MGKTKRIIESEIIQKFLDCLKFEKRFSENTGKNYGTDLLQFVVFLKGNVPVSGSVSAPDNLLISANTDSVRVYMAFLNEKLYSKVTIARKLATLKSFYRFLVKRKHIKSNPAAVIRAPKQEKKFPRFLEYEEVKRLLNTPPVNTLLDARDRAIMETLYSTGILVGELVALNMDGIDFLGEVVHVRGKGKKERIAPIGSSALQVIQTCMELRNKQARIKANLDFDTKALFVSEHGKRLGTWDVRRVMKRWLKVAGLDIKISPISLRHSFAVHMIRNGADLESVKEILGGIGDTMAAVYKYHRLARLSTSHRSPLTNC